MCGGEVVVASPSTIVASVERLSFQLTIQFRSQSSVPRNPIFANERWAKKALEVVKGMQIPACVFSAEGRV
jgi:hypothetical protein